jgi:hypothetical protein
MMRSMILAVASALTLLGCGGVDTNTTDDTSTAYSAALTVDSAVEESGLFAALAAQLQAGAGGPNVIATNGAKITSLFTPAGCATVTTVMNVDTFTFTKCTGPYGLYKLDGTLTATFTPMNTMVKIDLAATGFKISTSTVDVTASAVVNPGVTQDSATVTSTSSGTNARGETASRTGMYTAGWDGSCLTLDGTFNTTIGNVSWSTVVSNFRQCSGMCPDAGGTVTLTDMSGASVTVHYSNGASAEVTTSGSTRGMILLICGAA